MKLINQLHAAIKNALQFKGVIGNLRQVNDPHGQHLRRFSGHPNNAVPHDGGSRVNTEDDLLCFLCLLSLQYDTFAPIKGSHLKSARRTVYSLLRVVVFLAALGWLWHSIGDTFRLNDLRFTGDPTLLVLLLALLPVNSLIETLKWHVLTRPFSSHTFSASLKGVLIGSFYGLFTPNRVGDGAGRFHFIPAGMKTRGTYAFLNGSIAQSLATLLFGGLTLIFAQGWLRESDQSWFVAVSWIQLPVYIGTLLLLLLYVEPGWMRVLRDTLPQKGWFGQRVATLQHYTRRTNALILVLSIARYAVFATQFYLALKLYGFEGDPTEAGARIALIYLITTLIPTAALAEFGLRESMAILILPAAGIRPEAAFSATLVLYLVNIGIPAVAGGMLFTRLKKLHNA